MNNIIRELQSPEYIITLLRKLCTALLTDGEFNKFINAYVATRSRKHRAKHVAQLIELFNSRTNQEGPRKTFSTSLHTLLGKYNNISTGNTPDVIVTVRHKTTHPSLDWTCVGDSKHWNSCLSTGYDRNNDGKPSKEGYIEWLNSASYGDYEKLQNSGCNARYARRESDNYDSVTLLTTGNPVYEDGNGYTSRVRLHEGTTRVVGDGLTVTRPCLIWDRYYGNGEQLLPSWLKAIELAQERGVLLLRRDDTESKAAVKYYADKTNEDTYSDYFDDGSVRCTLVSSLHDVYKQRSGHNFLKDVISVRERTQSVRSFVTVDPDMLTWRYNRYAWVDKTAPLPRNVEHVTSTYELGDDYCTLYTNNINPNLRRHVVKCAIQYYGYPVKVCVDSCGNVVYCFDKQGGKAYSLHTYLSNSEEQCVSDRKHIFSSRGTYTIIVTEPTTGARERHTFYEHDNGHVVHLLTCCDYPVCEIACKFSEARRTLFRFGNILPKYVAQTTSIPGTPVTRMKKRSPIDHKLFVYSKIATYLRDLPRMNPYNSRKAVDRFMSLTVPYMLDAIERHDAAEV